MGREHGLLMNLIVGIFGAFLAAFLVAFLAGALGLGFGGAWGNLLVPTVGAIVLLALLGTLRPRHMR